MFDPRPDITAHELATLLSSWPNALLSKTQVDFEALPENVKRHFTHRPEPRIEEYRQRKQAVRRAGKP